MKTKLTLKYSSFFFCNSIQLKKGQEVEVETDTLTSKDVHILNAYISSGGIVSSEGRIPVELEEVVVTEQATPEPAKEEVKEEVIEQKEETTEEAEKPTEEVEAPVKKAPVKRTTKKTK